MAKVVSVKPKSISFQQLAQKASLDSAVKGVPSVLMVDKDSNRFEGLTIPCNVRVRTPQGIHNTNGLYLTKLTTTIVKFESGKIVEGAPSHRLFGNEWIALKDLIPGSTLKEEVVSSVSMGTEQIVADICVPGPHSYLLDNGIISHNSLLANQLNINQALTGYKTALAPLEMSSTEMMSRAMSAVSGQSSIDIFLKRLATGERDDVYRKFRRFDRKVAQANGRYTIFKPKEDLSIEELLSSLHSYNSDVIYIDYISLLKGADGEDQWRKLGQIARFGKIYAENHNKVLVLLAQVNEDGKLRYSQAIKEHSSLAWTFVATKESREKGYLNIEMLKSRNQVMKPFTLGIDYSKMSVYDLKPEDQERLDQEPSTLSSGSKAKGRLASSHKKSSSSDYAPNLAE